MQMFDTTKWASSFAFLTLQHILENKFAVGSGAKTVCICYYEQENNWYLTFWSHFSYHPALSLQISIGEISLSWHLRDLYLYFKNAFDVLPVS